MSKPKRKDSSWPRKKNPPDPSHHAYTPHRSGDDGRCYYTSDFANFCGASVEAHASLVQEQPAEDTMQEETIPVPTEPKPEGAE